MFELDKALTQIGPLNARQLQHAAEIVLKAINHSSNLVTLLGKDLRSEAGVVAVASVATDLAQLIADVTKAEEGELEDLCSMPLTAFAAIVGAVAQRVADVNGPIFQKDIAPMIEKLGAGGGVKAAVDRASKVVRRK